MIIKTKQTNAGADEASPNLRNFVNRITSGKLLKSLLIILILLFVNGGTIAPVMSKGPSDLAEMTYPVVVRMRIHDQLVTEVRNYIKRVAPKSKINPELLVNLCVEYEMDITFVLAQGFIESQLGTTGTAAYGNKIKKTGPTNSVFNVGTWDADNIYHRYKNVNESIEPYLKLLKTKYLEDKTLPQLLRQNGYKNHDGNRFAVDPLYESKILATMSNINMSTSIKMYQGVISLDDGRIRAYFGPTKNMADSVKLASL